MRALAILAATACLLGSTVPTPSHAQDSAGNTALSAPFRGDRIRRGSFPLAPANSRQPEQPAPTEQRIFDNDRPNFYPEDGSDGYRPGYGYRKGSFGYQRNRRR